MQFWIGKSAVFLALATAIVAVPLETVHKLHERRDNHPQSWVKRSKVPGSAKLPIRIGLKQHNLQAGQDLLLEM